MFVHVPLADNFGEADMETLYSLEDDLFDRLDGSGAGEFDGNEIGGGEWVLYLYGPDADLLIGTIFPVLEQYDLPSGVIKRYGEPGAFEQRIDL
ncbi:MAG TPA: hypothetical protein VGR43_09755 [Dehalococcoidia bacterium]|nr:hypothetical protein [Dehalococcoidia bacterium]